MTLNPDSIKPMSEKIALTNAVLTTLIWQKVLVPKIDTPELLLLPILLSLLPLWNDVLAIFLVAGAYLLTGDSKFGNG